MLVIRIVTAIVVILTVAGMIVGFDWGILRFAFLASIILIMLNVLDRLTKPQPKPTVTDPSTADRPVAGRS